MIIRNGVRTAGCVLMLAAAGLAAGCGQQSQPTPSQPAAAASPTTVRPVAPTAATPSVAASPTIWPVVLPVPSVPPGLHQTAKLPSAKTPVFHAEMTDLWASVVADRPELGLLAFFPLAAYQQVKAIADPAEDWRDRLVADFRLDIGAAHQLLGRQARRAALVRVVVDESEANWIPPGTCDNSVGYWHMGGARLVYKAGGQLRSIGIASLISWRGRWYVVHFGAVLRSSAAGVVDEPEAGPGIPGPPGGC